MRANGPVGRLLRGKEALLALDDRANVRAVEYVTPCTLTLRLLAMSYAGDDNWVLITDGRSERWVRLYGVRALRNLVRHYGFIDAHQCLNASTRGAPSIVVHLGPPHTVRRAPLLDGLRREHLIVRGVKQRRGGGGICWYCAMVFVMLFSPQMRAMFRCRAPTALQQRLHRVLEESNGEGLRRYLYAAYALGDRPDQAPHLDGQNGFTQLSILLARLDIPTTRLIPQPDQASAGPYYEMTDPVVDQEGKEHALRAHPRSGEAGLLVVRCFRSKWIPPPTITRHGRVYRLVAMLIGSEYCGHQVGASVVDAARSEVWALTDSDATQKGLGPMFWRTPRRPTDTEERYMRRWHRSWKMMIPTTLFGDDQVCDLNPVNRPQRWFETSGRAADAADAADVGRVNTDYIYWHPG